jgi:amidase
VHSYTPIDNAAGCPGMSVPLGMDDGLPVGLHVAAPPGCERRLLSLGYELEEAAPWWGRRPDTSWLQEP